MFLLVAQDYFRWHYGRAFRELFHVWKNLVWFSVQFFSLPQLLATLFSPYKRIVEERQKGATFEDVLGSILVNLLSRLVGFILRSSIIIVGLFATTLLCALGLIIYIVWFALPLIAVTTTITGIALLFT